MVKTKDILIQQKKVFLKALEQSLGIVTRASEKSGILRNNHYNWLRSDPEYKEAVDELNELVVDFAEGKLFDLIEDGDTAATIFLLKCRGKKRGYIERIDVTSDDKPMQAPVIVLNKHEG